MAEGLNGQGDLTPAGIGVRVSLLEKRDIDIEKQVNVIRDTMATKADSNAILARMETIAATQTARIEAIATQQQQSSRPNYNLMVSIVGTAMVFLTMIGAFAYWPINTATADLKLAVIALDDKKVPQRQYDADLVRMERDHQQLRSDLSGVQEKYVQQQRVARDEEDVARLRESTLPRKEFENQHAADETRFGALVQRMMRLEDMQMKR